MTLQGIDPLILAVFLGALSLGRRGAVIVGFGMVPRGEVGVVIASLGLAAGVFSNRIYAIIVAMSCVQLPGVIGMTYDQFWHGDVWLAKVYRDAEELRERRANVEAWRNGFYTASALSSTVGNMFRKKGSKPIKYMDRPIPLTQKEKIGRAHV